MYKEGEEIWLVTAPPGVVSSGPLVVTTGAFTLDELREHLDRWRDEGYTVVVATVGESLT